MFLPQFGINRQGESFLAGSLSLGKITLMIVEIGKSRLKVERRRIVNFAWNASRTQEVSEFVTPRAANDKLIVDMSAVGRCGRQGNFLEPVMSKKFLVARGRLPPPLGPFT